MPPRSLWSGTISFGLVSIPVNMVPAVRAQRLQFHMLHRKDNARLHRRMYCPEHNTVVHPEHIVRGYEVEPEQWVTVTEEELDSLEPKRSRSIEITDFVQLDDIPALYYDRPYYLLPDGAGKPYNLLVEALSRSKRAGLARFVMHGREHLVAVRAIESALCLIMLHYPSEIRPADDLQTDASQADKDAVKTFRRAASGLKWDFDPQAHENQSLVRLQQIIEKKRKKVGTVEAPESSEAETQEEEAEEETGESVDLVAALEASLARAKNKRRK